MFYELSHYPVNCCYLVSLYVSRRVVLVELGPNGSNGHPYHDARGRPIAREFATYVQIWGRHRVWHHIFATILHNSDPSNTKGKAHLDPENGGTYGVNSHTLLALLSQIQPKMSEYEDEDWDDLPEDVQAAFQKLGYTKKMWDKDRTRESRKLLVWSGLYV